MKEFVSIILPCYNASEFIRFAIESVILQSYNSWELIIIDDCSEDDSVMIIKDYCLRDSRIRLICLDKNSGSPVLPRNIGITSAKGRFIAFIDSDDIWESTKLSHQIPLFLNDDCAIVYSNYISFNKNGKSVVTSPNSVDYENLLKGNVIACSSAIYDKNKAENIRFENIGHEDFLFWLSILKQGYLAYNSCCFDFRYRIVADSLSSNKFKSAFWHWNILYNVEQLSLHKSFYYFFIYIYKALIKRI